MRTRQNLSDAQKQLLEKLKAAFGRRPSKLKSEGKNVWASFSAESRLKEVKGVKFIHSFLISQDGRILERKTLSRKG